MALIPAKEAAAAYVAPATQLDLELAESLKLLDQSVRQRMKDYKWTVHGLRGNTTLWSKFELAVTQAGYTILNCEANSDGDFRLYQIAWS